MKKKLICLAMTLALTVSMSAAAFATDAKSVNEESNPKTASTTVTTSVSPTYIVTIPTDAAITFNATSTELGEVGLTKARLDYGYAIQVSASAGALQNQADTEKTIPYTLNTSSGGAFTSTRFTAVGQSTTLTVDIAQDDWNKAYAGSYSGTITFTVSYVSTATE